MRWIKTDIVFVIQEITTRKAANSFTLRKVVNL